MNVLFQALQEIEHSALSLRESNMLRGEYVPDDDTREEVERLEKIAALMGHALETLGIIRADRNDLGDLSAGRAHLEGK